MSVRSVDLACRSWSDLGVVLREQKSSPTGLRMAREIIRWQTLRRRRWWWSWHYV